MSEGKWTHSNGMLKSGGSHEWKKFYWGIDETVSVIFFGIVIIVALIAVNVIQIGAGSLFGGTQIQSTSKEERRSAGISEEEFLRLPGVQRGKH